MFKNIDKVKKNIGETVFNHINSLSKTELEKQLSELKEELKSVNNDGGQRYLKLKDEEFYLLYRLERANEFKYKTGGGVEDNKKSLIVLPKDKTYFDIVLKRAGIKTFKIEKHSFDYTYYFYDAKDRERAFGYLHTLFSKGGGVDINELNMPVIRTQFEDEEYEFKDGGNVKVGDKVMLPEIKMRDGKIQFEKVENGEVLYIENGIYGVLNPKTKRIHQVSLNQIKYKDGGKIYSSDDRWVVTFQNQDSSEFEKVTVRANNKKSAIASAEDESGLGSDWEYYSAEKQMANGGTTKGFCYTIGGL